MQTPEFKLTRHDEACLAQVCGKPVHISRLLADVPKLKIDPACPCSDKVRSEINQYLLDNFGTKAACITDGTRYYMSPAFAEQLLKARNGK
jgi:hypothetical protein